MNGSKILEEPLGDLIVLLTAETRRAARHQQEIRVLIVNSLRDVWIARAWSSAAKS